MNFKIIGTGGFAVELFGLLISSGHEVIGCYGPRPDRMPSRIWLGDDRNWEVGDKVPHLIAIGDPLKRRDLFFRAKYSGLELGSFIHPSAHLSSHVEFGRGVIIYPGAVVHTDCSLADGVFLNSNVSLGHETKVLNFCNVQPNSAFGGRCTFGPESIAGIGSSFRENVDIGRGVTVGAGAVVVSNITMPGVYVGCPARRIDNA